MSTVQNNFAAASDEVTAPIAAATAVNQGDFVKVVSNLIVPIAAATDTAFGVAGFTNPTVSLLDKVTSGKVSKRGLFWFYLNTGDTVGFDDLVYLTTDPQVVTSSSAGGATKAGRVREWTYYPAASNITGAASNATRILVDVNVEGNV